MALSRLLAGVPKAHAKTIKQLYSICVRLTGRPTVVKTSKKVKQFVKNQKYAGARVPAGSGGQPPCRAVRLASDAVRGTLSTASPRTGRPRNGFDLRRTVVAPPEIVQGIPLLQQGVVDFLYTALSDFTDFMRERFARMQWCVTWGTLLGVYRIEGFIPWDSDIDVAVVVNSAEEFKSAVLPELIHYMQAKGHKLIIVSPCGLKIGPKSCPDFPANLSLFKEVKNRLAESSRHRGVKTSRSSLCTLTKQRLQHLPAAKTERLRAAALGPHVVDVEVIFRRDDGAFKFDGYDFEVRQLKMASGVFGPLTVPVPVSGTGQVEPILKAMYPGGFRKPIFRHWITGKLTPVPNTQRLRTPSLPSILLA